MVEELLFKTGIASYKTYLQFDLGASAQPQINMDQKAPVNIGWIYGISVLIGGTVPTNQTQNIISKADAGNLYVTFKIAANMFIDTWRLSDLVFQEAGQTREQERNYAPVSIPNILDWQKSYINNPTGIVSKTILFQLWYVDAPSYGNLVQSGVLWQQGKKPGT